MKREGLEPGFAKRIRQVKANTHRVFMVKSSMMNRKWNKTTSNFALRTVCAALFMIIAAPLAQAQEEYPSVGLRDSAFIRISRHAEDDKIAQKPGNLYIPIKGILEIRINQDGSIILVYEGYEGNCKIHLNQDHPDAPAIKALLEAMTVNP